MRFSSSGCPVTQFVETIILFRTVGHGPSRGTPPFTEASNETRPIEWVTRNSSADKIGERYGKISITT